MKTDATIVLMIFGNERCVVSLDVLEAAAKAIHSKAVRESGRSLLAVGITEVQGEFESGALVGLRKARLPVGLARARRFVFQCLGQGANSQVGPVRPTALPSGQRLASSVHACGPGQGANSQFGPVRPTELPSGQSFASIVQALTTPPVLMRFAILNWKRYSALVTATPALFIGSTSTSVIVSASVVTVWFNLNS